MSMASLTFAPRRLMQLYGSRTLPGGSRRTTHEPAVHQARTTMPADFGDLSYQRVGALGFPKDRVPEPRGAARLPAGTVVVSADNHFSVDKDIFYARFPARLKDRAPRVWWENGVCHIGMDGKSFLTERLEMLTPSYELVPGCNEIEPRLRDLDAEGIDKEIVFPNSILQMMRCMEFEVRETFFRIYNEYMAEMGALAPGRFHGVGVLNYWDPARTRDSIAEIKALGLKTFFTPLNPGLGADGQAIDYTSEHMDPFWGAIAESGLPLSIHIGENPIATARGGWGTSLMVALSSFRKIFGDMMFGGVFDRHPSLRVVFNECGINWAAGMLQDAEFVLGSMAPFHDWKVQREPRDYWRRHCHTAFITDKLGLGLLDIVGADKVMWSADYPHPESSFGYNWSSMQAVADAVPEDQARAILGGTAIEVFGL
jgi:predicted TIM-barrel fold metal-dependent hydrolase